VEEARRQRLLSDEHFTVDGTLLDAWAAMKSVRPTGEDQAPPPAGRNPDVDYRGQRRTNATHRSTTDPDARLARKGDGQATRLCFAGHVLMEHRSGLAVDVQVTRAVGAPEWAVALDLLERLPGGDYDLVKDVLAKEGEIDFWTVRMRPGKPLAFGAFPSASRGRVRLGRRRPSRAAHRPAG